MTKERAQYLLDNRPYGSSLKRSFFEDLNRQGLIYPDGITPEEDTVIRQLWNTMPRNTTYTDAVLKIAKGQG